MVPLGDEGDPPAAAQYVLKRREELKIDVIQDR
jgi:hypothetical protein